MSKSLNERTLVIAHRGACGYAPENTMPAFELAAEMKADGIETDVHFSKDGEIVIVHDNKLDRTSNGQGQVTFYTLEELRQFDFGMKFDPKFRYTRIPTIGELFDLCYKQGMVLNIEIKSNDPELPAKLFEECKKHNMVEQTFYSSFDHEQLARMLRVYPEAYVAPLYGFNMIKPWLYGENMGARAVHPKYDQLFLYPEYVEECHSRGLRVNTWTVNDAEDAKKLIDLGADALITNYPDVMRSLLVKE